MREPSEDNKARFPLCQLSDDVLGHVCRFMSIFTITRLACTSMRFSYSAIFSFYAKTTGLDFVRSLLTFFKDQMPKQKALYLLNDSGDLTLSHENNARIMQLAQQGMLDLDASDIHVIS